MFYLKPKFIIFTFFLIQFKPKTCAADIVDDVVKAKRMVNFSVSSSFSNWSLSRKFPLTKSRTCLISHTNIYLGLGGLKLNTLDASEQILGCFPAGKLSQVCNIDFILIKKDQ